MEGSPGLIMAGTPRTLQLLISKPACIKSRELIAKSHKSCTIPLIAPPGSDPFTQKRYNFDNKQGPCGQKHRDISIYVQVPPDSGPVIQAQSEILGMLVALARVCCTDAVSQRTIPSRSES